MSKIQGKLKKATVRTFELSPQTSNDLKYIIFERLNKGGTKLNDMEIRNCLYRGSLNNLIKKLINNEEDHYIRRQLLEETFGSTGTGCFVEPTLQFDYGFNIHVGKNRSSIS